MSSEPEKIDQLACIEQEVLQARRLCRQVLSRLERIERAVAQSDAASEVSEECWRRRAA